MQNILEQSHFTPFPNRNVAFAQNWSANIDNLEDGGGPWVGPIDQNNLCSKYFAFDCRWIDSLKTFSILVS